MSALSSELRARAADHLQAGEFILASGYHTRALILEATERSAAAAGSQRESSRLSPQQPELPQ
jgi:hypothetical protein